MATIRTAQYFIDKFVPGYIVEALVLQDLVFSIATLGTDDLTAITQTIAALSINKADATLLIPINQAIAALGTSKADQSLIGPINLAIAGKQETLSSAINIKTINGTSILGPGNITISTGAPADNEFESFANLASFPATGETDLLYLAKDTGKFYFWNGATYEAQALTLSSVTGLIAALASKADQSNLDTTNTNVTALQTGKVSVQSGFGLVANTEITKLSGLSQYFINVKNFGCTGDGTTNDTTNFQLAVNSLTSGTTLFIPSGTYLIDQINFTGLTNIRILGNYSTIKLNFGSNISAFKFLTCTNVAINFINFIGTSDSSTLYNNTNFHCGIHATTSANFTISNNSFTKFSSFAIYAFTLKDASGVNAGTNTDGFVITQNKFHDFPFDSVNTSALNKLQCAVNLGGDAEYSIISQNKFFNLPSAIRLTDAANTTIAENIVMGGNGALGTFDRAMIYLANGTSNFGKYKIFGNHVNHNEGNASGGTMAIVAQGDGNVLNGFSVNNNSFILNGSATLDRQAVFVSCPCMIFSNNNVRGRTGTISGDYLTSFTTCHQSMISNNIFGNGINAIKNDGSSSLRIGQNYKGSTNILLTLNSGTALTVTEA